MLLSLRSSAHSPLFQISLHLSINHSEGMALDWYVVGSTWFTPADTDADWYCWHFIHSPIRPTIHGIETGHCGQIAYKKWSTCWYADVPDDLSLYGIDTDGICCHPMTSSVRPRDHELGFSYCRQIDWKRAVIWHAGVFRWLTVSLSTLMRFVIRPSIRSTFWGFCANNLEGMA